MSIAKIKLDESTKLQFGVSITGADGRPETRFVIDGKDFSVSFPCKPTTEGVEVEITGLKDIFKAGEYDARLEVVLENKIYTPMIDKIEFEPSVSIATQSKPAMKESIKVQAVTIKKPIDENLLRKTQAATIIAQSLHYNDISGKTPEQVINSALEEAGELTKEQIETVQEMLKLAEEVGLTYNKDFVPVFIEPEINPVVVEEKKPEENDGWSEEDLESMANTVDDWDDIVDLYGPGELHIVDTDTGETVDDLKEELKEETLNEVLSRVERIRAKMRFHKSAAKRERKLKVALHKHSDSSTINHRARTMAIKLMKQKLAKKPLSQMSVAEKERVEKIIAKRGAVVNRMAMKLTQRIRTIEKQRLSR